MLHETIRSGQFLAQHSVATFLQTAGKTVLPSAINKLNMKMNDVTLKM